MPDEQYISKKAVAASYRPRSYVRPSVEPFYLRKNASLTRNNPQVMSPGLQRARAPFRFRNAITGIILAGFGVGVWAYSISAVKQDDFSDVDEEARTLMRTGTSGAAAAEEVKATVMDEAKVGTVEAPNRVPVEVTTATVVSRPRGVLVPTLERRFPRLLDPSRKTLVWGAPPVDNIGRLGDSI